MSRPGSGLEYPKQARHKSSMRGEMKKDVAEKVTNVLVFLMIALVAGLFGFSGIAGTVALAGRSIASLSFLGPLLSLVIERPRRI